VIRQAIKEPVGRGAFCYLRRHAPGWIPRLQRKRGLAPLVRISVSGETESGSAGEQGVMCG
jgi:hypothetical protein